LGAAIGIGFGHVLNVDERDLFGHEVNLACRMPPASVTAGTASRFISWIISRKQTMPLRSVQREKPLMSSTRIARFSPKSRSMVAVISASASGRSLISSSRS